MPRTHLLLDLFQLLLPHYGTLRSLRRGLDMLTRFAVEVRYPDYTATKREAAAALRWAKRVRTDVLALLGIVARRRKKSP